MNGGHDTHELLSFNCWLGEQPFESRIVICGNHDRLFQDSPQEALALLMNAIYLENSGVTINGVSFWGSPCAPEFMDWAFMHPRGPRVKLIWDQIPEYLDVLITHGPPFGIRDQINPSAEHLGCKELRKAVEAKRPKVHVFGHVHGGAGTLDNGTTISVNAAFLNERYKPYLPAGKIHVIEL